MRHPWQYTCCSLYPSSCIFLTFAVLAIGSGWRLLLNVPPVDAHTLNITNLISRLRKFCRCLRQHLPVQNKKRRMPNSCTYMYMIINMNVLLLRGTDKPYMTVLNECMKRNKHCLIQRETLSQKHPLFFLVVYNAHPLFVLILPLSYRDSDRQKTVFEMLVASGLLYSVL